MQNVIQTTYVRLACSCRPFSARQLENEQVGVVVGEKHGAVSKSSHVAAITDVERRHYIVRPRAYDTVTIILPKTISVPYLT